MCLAITGEHKMNPYSVIGFNKVASHNNEAEHKDMSALKFERVECSRCGGTGRYSFNLKDGNKCYGCKGKGLKLTKRGTAANKWMTEKLLVNVEDIVIGDRIQDGGTRFTVMGIKIADESISFGAKFNGEPWEMGFLKGSKVKTIPSNENREALLIQAIEYQSTLTKQGMLRKKRWAA
jgi:hypothetical protein